MKSIVTSALLIMLAVNTAYAGDTAFSSIIDANEIKQIMRSFQKELEFLGSNANILQCSDAVRFYGRDNWGRDTSYGAHCVVSINGESRTFFMCDDEMVGKFTVQSSGALSEDWIRNFVENSCPPGG